MSASTSLRVCVIDDEPPARRALEWLLSREPGVAVVGSTGDGASAVALLEETRPDAVFLDVQMPGLDGFEVLRRLTPPAPTVVFVTAYDAYAVRAFEAQALDYLVKPFSDERFSVVMARVRQLVTVRPSGQPLVVREGHRTLVLPPAEIEWIEAEDYYVRIHAGTRRPLIRRTLQSVLEALEPEGFMRVHRSAAVNLSAVREVRPLSTGDGEVLLASGHIVRVSRQYRAGLVARVARDQ
jgi:two-component system LytT family response regulator